MTKAALLREAQTREQLRKDFLSMQEAVKATEIILPFVFYDGTNIPGGNCKVKKGDHIWVFLDRSRKVAAELGVGGGEKASNRREWARVGVDDLMLVRGEVIIPHVSCPSQATSHCILAHIILTSFSTTSSITSSSTVPKVPLPFHFSTTLPLLPPSHVQAPPHQSLKNPTIRYRDHQRMQSAQTREFPQQKICYALKERMTTPGLPRLLIEGGTSETSISFQQVFGKILTLARTTAREGGRMSRAMLSSLGEGLRSSN